MYKYYLIILILVLQLILKCFVNQQYTTPRLLVEFIDVGQGDSILIETNNKNKILVDTGPDNRIVEKLSQQFPSADLVIDYLILTHSDSDHIGGAVELLKNFQVKNIIYNFNIDPNAGIQKALENQINIEGSKKLKVTENSDFIIDGCMIDFIWPNTEFNSTDLDDNDSSIAFVLSYKDINVFLGGDISSVVEKKLIPVISPVEIMKMNHHGSNTANISEFLTILSPEVGVITVGKNNHYNLPNKLVLKRLQELNIQMFRTDINGDIFCKIYNTSEYNCSNNYF
jgi:competence protein ComEC